MIEQVNGVTFLANGRILTGKSFMELIATMSMVMDMEENLKLYHGWRVALFADKIGEILGMSTDELFFGGLLHDIGALGLEDHIVHRVMNGRYLDDPLIIGHPKTGAEIIKKIPGMKRVALYIEDHHERWDGKGYPACKKGREIFPGSQVILAADLIDLSLRSIATGNVGKVSASFSNNRNFFRPDIFNASMELLQDASLLSEMWDYGNLKDLIDSRILSAEDFFSPVEHQGEIFIQVFADIIDAKHTYTGGHSRRVGQYSCWIADILKLDRSFQENLYKAAVLHDFGKVAVPKRILEAPRLLTKEEYNIVKQHAVHTTELLNSVSSLAFLAEAAGYHHERFDGKGYPIGLRGTDIPLLSRIISLADSLDAITTNRPYQSARTFDQAIRIISEESGSQFDPEIAWAAVELIKAINFKEKIV